MTTPHMLEFYSGRMDLREMSCEERDWMELAQGHAQWRALVIAVLNLRVLLPES
jgi:hypothetical protein